MTKPDAESGHEIVSDPRALFQACSNWGVWGPDDELGTLNYISPEKLLSALSMPRHGTAVGIGRELRIGGGEVDQVEHFDGETTSIEGGVLDEWRVTPHGFGVTHLDAIGHTSFEDEVYGGRNKDQVYGKGGLSFGSVIAYESGIITRGVLLDVAAARGVEYLEQGEGVSAADLDAAVAGAGVPVGTGDAIFLRTGLAARRASHGYDGDDIRTGVLPEVANWLHDREVAVYSGDCIEQLPSGYSWMSHPLHVIGQVAMGLCILDVPDVERLAEACHRNQSSEFLLIVAPLRVAGSSGSPVNPLAVF